MNIRENQYVKSSGIILMLSLMSACLMVILFPWNYSSTESQSKQAIQKAEVVGYQVVQLFREAQLSKVNSNQSNSENRSIASVDNEDSGIRTTGFMGQDPWGNPFHYRLIKVSEGKSKILVWSSGPNGKVDNHDFDNEELAIALPPEYQGDDVGVVLSLDL